MIKFLLVLAAAAVAAPAVAGDVQLDFVRDGEHFVGTVHDDVHGRHVDGRDLTTGKTFSLVIAGGRVTGTYDDAGVDFAAVAEPTETASR